MSENDGASRARALQAWWDARNAPAAAPAEPNANDRAKKDDAPSDEPLAPDTNDVGGSGEDAIRPAATRRASGSGTPADDVSGASGAARPKRDASTEATVPADAPPEIQKAPKRGKNAKGETMRDVVLAMTDAEMQTFAADMATIQRAYGTRNLAATLLQSTAYVADIVRKLDRKES